MRSRIEETEETIAVLREWSSTEVTARVDDAIRSYRSFASELETDPAFFGELDREQRYRLLLEMAEVGARQVARLARIAEEGRLSMRAGRDVQSALGGILRAAGRELAAMKEQS